MRERRGEQKGGKKIKSGLLKIWQVFILMGMDYFIHQDRKLRAWLFSRKRLSAHTSAAILNLMAAILDLPLSHMSPHVSLNIGRWKEEKEGKKRKKKRKKKNASPTLRKLGRTSKPTRQENKE